MRAVVAVAVAVHLLALFQPGMIQQRRRTSPQQGRLRTSPVGQGLCYRPILRSFRASAANPSVRGPVPVV